MHINIKGTSYGLVIQMGSGDWADLLAELASRLEQTPAFFKGGRVALQVGPRHTTPPQLEQVGSLLKAHQMSLWAVVSESDGTREAATAIGLETALSPPRPAGGYDRGDIPQAEADEQSAFLVRRTLRSGQSLRYAGHVVVMGDVNPGAEVVAGGDVIVWGRLRGIVHAGAGGDDEARVWALALTPTQLRINRLIARAPSARPDQASANTVTPEVAFVHDGQIVVEAWGQNGDGDHRQPSRRWGGIVHWPWA